MYTKSTEENTQEARSELTLLLRSGRSHRLTRKLVTAFYAYDSKGIALLSTVRAIA